MSEKEGAILFKQEFDASEYLDGGTLVLDDVLLINEEEFTISRTVVEDGKEIIRQAGCEICTVAYSLRDMLFLQHAAAIFGKKRAEGI